MTIRILPYKADLPAGSLLVPLSLHNADYDTRLMLHAAELADRDQLPLLAMHAVHEPADLPGLYQKLWQPTRAMPMEEIAKLVCLQRLESLQKLHAHLHALQSLDLYLIPGLPESRIVQVAERYRCSSILMAEPEHQPHLLPRLFSNSTTESVLRNSPCPVYLVAMDMSTRENAPFANEHDSEAERLKSDQAALPLPHHSA